MLARQKFALKIGNRRVRLGERTLIMGVLNVTPDSFSDGARYFSLHRAVSHGLEMARQGADWIDVGGESTRPGAQVVPVEEEMRRVIPVIQAIHRKIPSLPISIDTTKAEVGEEAIRAGATILNDVSGLRFDPNIATVARRYHTPLVLMHIRGRPETMQQKLFARSVWRSVQDGLAWSIRAALNAGIRQSQLIIDPGLGFGKTRRQNFEILAHLERLKIFRLPILVGTSRKSFVQAVLAGEGLVHPQSKPQRKGGSQVIPPNYWALLAKTRAGIPISSKRTVGVLEHDTLSCMNLGDAAAVAASILAGAHIVRVHDVAGSILAARISDAILIARQ